ncbi:MAG: DUF1592 domain-containing protein [Planctomycetota bacterium]
MATLACVAFSSHERACAIDDFEDKIRPILSVHCFECHGGNEDDELKGEVRLDKLSQDMVHDRASMEIWHDALDAIQLGEMPPEDATPLGEKDRKILVEWIRENLDRALESIKGSSKGIVMRRINNAEYAYTMTDLLGLELDYAKDLPPDPVSKDGFLNNGQSLGMSSMQLQVYLRNARAALEKVLVEGEQPERIVETIKENCGFRLKGQVGDNSDQLGRAQQWIGVTSTLAVDGPITVRVKVRTNWREGQPVPRLGLRMGYFVGGLTTQFMKKVGEVRLTSGDWTVVEFTSRGELLPRPEASVPRDKLSTLFVLENTLDDAKPKPKQITKREEPKKGKKPKQIKVYERDADFPQIFVESVELVMNDYSAWPPPSHRRILAAGEDLHDPNSRRLVIERFLQRAWRRNPTNAELDVWCQHFEIIRQASHSDIEALRETLAASLASTPFLFLIEPESDSENVRLLTSSELASRLSYFLWSSTPDDALLQMALHSDHGDLGNQNVSNDGAILSTIEIEKQFERMWQDPRSERFVEQFCGQWLDLDSLQRVAINPQYYKSFDDALKEDMVAESKEYFRHLLRHDLSALQLLHSDFTMLNARLAKHYGIEGPTSQDFTPISLEGTERPGGLLGHAATHMAGSDGVNSHPIKRAVWIRERLLNDPPAPPPPDVPELEASAKGKSKLTVREQLQVHRQKDSCGDCHRSIDPWGIAMEHYDAIGLWRDRVKQSKEAVDARTALPGNYSINGLEELQSFLIQVRRQQFAKALVAKLMTYALGRSLDLADQPVIDELTERFVDNEYKIRLLMRDIVTSEPFLNR